MKKLFLRLLTALSALQAGRVFSVDSITIIASCKEDSDIVAAALEIIKKHSDSRKWHKIITENIRRILVSRNKYLPPFCVWHNTKQLSLKRDFIQNTTPLITASMLINYAILLRDDLPPYSACAIEEQLRFLATSDTVACQTMINYYRQLKHDFTFSLPSGS